MLDRRPSKLSLALNLPPAELHFSMVEHLVCTWLLISYFTLSLPLLPLPELQLSEPSLFFSDSPEQSFAPVLQLSTRFMSWSSVTSPPSVHLFPSLHSLRSFIKKLYQLHQASIVNNRLALLCL